MSTLYIPSLWDLHTLLFLSFDGASSLRENAKFWPMQVQRFLTKYKIFNCSAIRHLCKNLLHWSFIDLLVFAKIKSTATHLCKEFLPMHFGHFYFILFLFWRRRARRRCRCTSMTRNLRRSMTSPMTLKWLCTKVGVDVLAVAVADDDADDCNSTPVCIDAEFIFKREQVQLWTASFASLKFASFASFASIIVSKSLQNRRGVGCKLKKF